MTGREQRGVDVLEEALRAAARGGGNGIDRREGGDAEASRKPMDVGALMKAIDELLLRQAEAQTQVADDERRHGTQLRQVHGAQVLTEFPVTIKPAVQNSNTAPQGIMTQKLTSSDDGMQQHPTVRFSTQGDVPVLQFFTPSRARSTQKRQESARRSGTPYMTTGVQAWPSSRRGPASKTSPYRGVSCYKRTGRWEAHIWHAGRQVHLGTYSTAHEAARVYDLAAIKLRGWLADLNFDVANYKDDPTLIDAPVRIDRNSVEDDLAEIVKGLKRRSRGLTGRRYKAGKPSVQSVNSKQACRSNIANPQTPGISEARPSPVANLHHQCSRSISGNVQCVEMNHFQSVLPQNCIQRQESTGPNFQWPCQNSECSGRYITRPNSDNGQQGHLTLHTGNADIAQHLILQDQHGNIIQDQQDHAILPVMPNHVVCDYTLCRIDPECWEPTMAAIQNCRSQAMSTPEVVTVSADGQTRHPSFAISVAQDSYTKVRSTTSPSPSTCERSQPSRADEIPQECQPALCQSKTTLAEIPAFWPGMPLEQFVITGAMQQRGQSSSVQIPNAPPPVPSQDCVPLHSPKAASGSGQAGSVQPEIKPRQRECVWSTDSTGATCPTVKMAAPQPGTASDNEAIQLSKCSPPAPRIIKLMEMIDGLSTKNLSASQVPTEDERVNKRANEGNATPKSDYNGGNDDPDADNLEVLGNLHDLARNCRKYNEGKSSHNSNVVKRKSASAGQVCAADANVDTKVEITSATCSKIREYKKPTHNIDAKSGENLDNDSFDQSSTEKEISCHGCENSENSKSAHEETKEDLLAAQQLCALGLVSSSAVPNKAGIKRVGSTKEQFPCWKVKRARTGCSSERQVTQNAHSGLKQNKWPMDVLNFSNAQTPVSKEVAAGEANDLNIRNYALDTNGNRNKCRCQLQGFDAISKHPDWAMNKECTPGGSSEEEHDPNEAE